MQQTVVCPSCNARYSLPPSVTATSAKCRRCEAIMPLQGNVPPVADVATADPPSGGIQVNARPRSRSVSRATAPPEPEQRRMSGRSGRRTTGRNRAAAGPAPKNHTLNKLCGVGCVVVVVVLVVLAIQ